MLGVLDSLLSAGLYDEMPFFIAKLHRLTESDYPQEFVRKVLAFIYLYDSFRLINCGAFADAQELYKQHDNRRQDRWTDHTVCRRYERSG